MTSILPFAALNLIAILALSAMYVTRHRRRDLVVSYMIINMGVFAVTVALANASAASAGMGGPRPVDGPKPSSMRAPSTGGGPQV